VKIRLKRVNKGEGNNLVNLTKDCLIQPKPLPLKKLCRKYMKVFINNKEISLTEATIKVFGRKSKINSYVIQMNVIFNLNSIRAIEYYFLLRY
jgi:hypothetical protein